MYYKIRIEIPTETGKIVRLKHRNGDTYINYEYDRVYDKDKKYTKPKRTTIGKMCADDETMMYPNPRFYEFFPQHEKPDEIESNPKRSRCIKIGTFLVIRKIIQDYKLDKTLRDLLGDRSGLFLDLAAYAIITEDNSSQYYPAYTYNHPLLTKSMYPYSDSTVSDFLESIQNDDSENFMDKWNESKDHREKIYISYDSTNKDCDSGAVNIAEHGHPKDKSGKAVFNYAIGYNTKSREPLFYEAYPGSIVDVSQLTLMAQRVLSYGYNRVGFIIDRGYFSEKNLHFLRGHGFSYIIMMRGMQELVNQTVKSVKGTFEKKESCYIAPFGDTGTTVSAKLFPSDKENSYVHVYYSLSKDNAESKKIHRNIAALKEWLTDQHGKVEGSFPVKAGVEHYFELEWSEPKEVKTAKGKPEKAKDSKEETSAKGKDEKDETPKKVRTLVSETKKTDVIDEELAMTGYFVLVTSEKMTAADALKLYKSRDASEKLFRGDKSYLGDAAMKTYSEESTEAKIFIEFVALIIRNKMYTCLLDAKKASVKKANYMDVPAAVAELEKIELIRASGSGELNNSYYMGHALTATQKAILKAFDMDAKYLENAIKALSNEIKQSDLKLEKGAGHENDDDQDDRC